MTILLNDLPHEYIVSRFDYDEVSGDLIWRNGRFAGSTAGSVFTAEHGIQYWRTKISGRSLFNHRIAWFIKTKTAPRLIDHWDGEGLNNAWLNLRDATYAQNRANSWNLERGVDPFPNGKWRAKITIDQHQHHLGMYDTKEEALEVYKAALTEVHGEYAVFNRRQ